MPAPADLVQWAARALSVGAALFFLVFAVGEGTQHGFSLSSFNARSGAMMVFLIVGLVANVLAWRWQVGGAAVALVALAGLGAVELLSTGRLPGVWFFILLGTPALLYVASALLRTRLTA